MDERGAEEGMGEEEERDDGKEEEEEEDIALGRVRHTQTSQAKGGW